MKEKIYKYLPYFIALLPILVLRDFTPNNELRYLSIANEALEQGHLFAFTLHGEIYADKPPFYLWLIMALKWLLGKHYMFGIALASFLPAIGIIDTMDKWVNKYESTYLQLLDGTSIRSLTRLILFTCGFQLFLAFVVRMDMLMSYFIVLSLYASWQLLQEDKSSKCRHHLQWEVGLWTFLALFTKGPIGFLIPLLSTTVYLFITKDIKKWKEIWNWRCWLVLVILTAIWFYFAWKEGGDSYINNLLFHQTLDRVHQAFHHSRPFYYYMLCIWYDSLPWGPLCIFAIGYTLYNRKRLTNKLQTYFLTIILTTFIMLSSFSGKLDVYLLPIYPFIVYLGVMQLRNWDWFQRDCKYIRHTGNVLLLTLFISGLTLPFTNSYFGCYGDVCKEVSKLKGIYSINHIYVYDLSRPLSMDVYLKEKPIIIEKDSIWKKSFEKAVLITKEKKEGDLPQSEDSLIKVGPFDIFYFK